MIDLIERLILVFLADDPSSIIYKKSQLTIYSGMK